ncbi:MAG: PBSX family phage terminase large subunit [Candidatus Dormibacteria bacterium]
MAANQMIEFPPKLECLFRPSRYKVLHGGRGAAKSWGIARALLVRAAEKPIRVLCAREVQKSITDSVHKLLSDQVHSMGLGAFFRITDTQIRGINGSEFFFAGIRGQSIENLKSYEGVDICWIEEAQVVTKRSWDVLIPTIRKEDSEIWLSLNEDLDTDETYVRFVQNPPKGAIVEFLTYKDNPWFPCVLEQERLACEERDPVGYRNIWEGQCRAAVDGAIYTAEVGKLIEEGRFRPVPHDPMLDVHTVWDLGWNDKMSIILVQRLGAEIRIIDYIEDSHLTLVDYVRALEVRKFRWGNDWLPHDGAAKDFKTGKSSQEILMQLGRKVKIVPRLEVEAGIKATRIVFPRIYVDSDKAGRLMDCLKRYRRMIPTTTNEPSSPLHDEYSHAADAVRYLALSVSQMVNEATFRKPIVYPKQAYA